MKSVIVSMITAAGLISLSNLATAGEDPLALANSLKLDCKSCHNVDKKLIGPAWKDVAAKYKGNASAQAMLVEKVIKGGNGNWNAETKNAKMTPHPENGDKNKKSDIEKVVAAILAL
jgi:cytochrome c